MDWIQVALGSATTAGLVWVILARLRGDVRRLALVGGVDARMDERSERLHLSTIVDRAPAADPVGLLEPPSGARVRRGAASELERSILLDDVVAELSKIPPLPRAIRGILRELGNLDASANSLARLVATEPVLTASVLRLVNSAAMGLRRQIMTVDEAVAYLGFSTVKTLVVRLKLGQMITRRNQMGRGYNNEHLWLHSVAVAAAAEELAKRVGGIDSSLAHTIGLLHDIGKLAINSTFPATVDKLFEETEASSEDSFLERERRLFGADHAFIGGFLARRWELPTELAEAIRLHHMPHTAEALAMLSETVRRVVCVVHLANQLAKYRHVYCESMEIDIVSDAVFQELGLEPDLEGLMDDRMRKTIESAVMTVTEPTSGAHYERYQYRRAG